MIRYNASSHNEYTHINPTRVSKYKRYMMASWMQPHRNEKAGKN